MADLCEKLEFFPELEVINREPAIDELAITIVNGQELQASVSQEATVGRTCELAGVLCVSVLCQLADGCEGRTIPPREPHKNFPE